MSRVMSIRFSDEVAGRLRQRADASGEHVSGLAQRLVDEGLRVEAHPGIVFRSGPSGRRAGLVQGPDVWEIVGLVRSLDARGPAAITEAADWLGLTGAQVRTALDYYGEFPDEIDREIHGNEVAAARVEEIAATQQQLLR